jgi:hypothetical protein
MSWKKARAFLSENAHVLALSRDNAALEVAKTADNCSIDAGIATLMAHLFMQEHGPLVTTKKAITIYRELISELKLKKEWVAKAKELQKKMDNTGEILSMCLGYNGINRDRGWPLKPCFRKINDRAGLANVMLALSCRELMDGTTTEKLAAQAIASLLSGGKIRDRKK